MDFWSTGHTIYSNNDDKIRVNDWQRLQRCIDNTNYEQIRDLSIDNSQYPKFGEHTRKGIKVQGIKFHVAANACPLMDMPTQGNKRSEVESTNTSTISTQNNDNEVTHRKSNNNHTQTKACC